MEDQVLAKFEMHPSVVNYLLQSVNSQQIRGVDGANDLLKVVAVLNNPKNKEELAEDAKKAEDSKDKKPK